MNHLEELPIQDLQIGESFLFVLKLLAIAAQNVVLNSVCRSFPGILKQPTNSVRALDLQLMGLGLVRQLLIGTIKDL